MGVSGICGELKVPKDCDPGGGKSGWSWSGGPEPLFSERSFPWLARGRGRGLFLQLEYWGGKQHASEVTCVFNLGGSPGPGISDQDCVQTEGIQTQTSCSIVSSQNPPSELPPQLFLLREASEEGPRVAAAISPSTKHIEMVFLFLSPLWFLVIIA